MRSCFIVISLKRRNRHWRRLMISLIAAGSMIGVNSRAVPMPIRIWSRRLSRFARPRFPTPTPSDTTFGTTMPNEPLPEWEALLSSAAHLQRNTRSSRWNTRIGIPFPRSAAKSRTRSGDSRHSVDSGVFAPVTPASRGLFSAAPAPFLPHWRSGPYPRYICTLGNNKCLKASFAPLFPRKGNAILCAWVVWNASDCF